MGVLAASPWRRQYGRRSESGAMPGALFFGTRPSNDGHFFARLLTEDDAAVFAQVHAAGPDDPPMLKRTWHLANPGLKHGLPLVSVLEAEARLAKRDPAELATFRALRLNGGTSEINVAYLIDPDTWREVETDELPPRSGPVSFGLDLGGVSAFSACSGWWPKTGRLEGFVACGTQPKISERGACGWRVGSLRGHAGCRRACPVGRPRCSHWCVPQRGQSSASGNRRPSLPTGGVLANSRTVFARPGCHSRNPLGEDKASKTARKISACSGAPCLTGKWPLRCPLAMRSALSEAKTVTDASANEKLARSGQGQHRRRGRDDLAAAIILAVAEGCRREGAKVQRRWRYRGVA